MKTLTRSLLIALAALLPLALPASAAERGGLESNTDSPLVDFLLSDGMTREELAGLYQALEAGELEPPPCVVGEEMFDDVPAENLFCPWIEELARRDVTGGCDADNYCPGDPVSRAQMAAFIVRAIEAARPMFATIAPAGDDPQIIRGRGATNVMRSNDPVGGFLIDFERDVMDCTWLATYGPPGGQFVSSLWATVRGSTTNPNRLFVVLRDENGDQADGSGFHVEVLCP